METRVTQVTPASQVARNLAKLGSLALIIAAFLPWGTVDEVSIKGLEGDGIITLGIGIITLIILHLKKISLWYSLILGLVAEVIAIIQSFSVSDKITEIKEVLSTSLIRVDINGNIGFGVYLSLIAGGLIVFGSLIQWLQSRKK